VIGRGGCWSPSAGKVSPSVGSGGRDEHALLPCAMWPRSSDQTNDSCAKPEPGKPGPVEHYAQSSQAPRKPEASPAVWFSWFRAPCHARSCSHYSEEGPKPLPDSGSAIILYSIKLI
jgi:hypothetical protein